MLLLGLKNNSASGTFHGADGFEGISMEGTQVSILKEGTAKELKQYVSDKRDLAKKAKVSLDKLENSLDIGNITFEEYEKKAQQYISQKAITKFNQLIIVEGEII